MGSKGSTLKAGVRGVSQEGSLWYSQTLQLPHSCSWAAFSKLTLKGWDDLDRKSVV